MVTRGREPANSDVKLPLALQLAILVSVALPKESRLAPPSGIGFQN